MLHNTFGQAESSKNWKKTSGNDQEKKCLHHDIALAHLTAIAKQKLNKIKDRNPSAFHRIHLI